MPMLACTSHIGCCLHNHVCFPVGTLCCDLTGLCLPVSYFGSVAYLGLAAVVLMHLFVLRWLLALQPHLFAPVQLLPGIICLRF
jgi:hypothetical protein